MCVLMMFVSTTYECVHEMYCAWNCTVHGIVLHVLCEYANVMYISVCISLLQVCM